MVIMGGLFMDYKQIAIELFIGYWALFFITKWLGKNQMSQVTVFDFISALILGELVGNTLYNESVDIFHILFAVGIWGMLIFITEWITQKFRRTRPFLEGGPTIVIHKGKIDFDALKKNHLDINQLQHLLREKGVFSIREVQYGILETNGTVSVLRKSAYDSVTKKDLGIYIPSPTLSYTVVLDGEIVKDNVASIGWNEEKLKEELKKIGYGEVKNILFAEWNEEEGLFAQTYNEGKNTTN